MTTSTAKRVALLAMKGGVGKTTVTLGLASAARSRGLRVLVVDLDPQRNSTGVIVSRQFVRAHAAARTRREEPEALLDVLEIARPTRADVERAIQRGRETWSGVDVLPATRSLQSIERAGPEMVAKLGTMLGLIEQDYDLILIDTRPAFGLLTTMAVYAAHILLAVAECKKFGAEGLVETWSQLEQIMEAGLPVFEEAVVIANQFDARQIEDRERMADVRKHFGGILWPDVLPDRTVISLAINADMPLYDYPDARRDEPVAVLDTWLDTIMKGRDAA